MMCEERKKSRLWSFYEVVSLIHFFILKKKVHRWQCFSFSITCSRLRKPSTRNSFRWETVIFTYFYYYVLLLFFYLLLSEGKRQHVWVKFKVFFLGFVFGILKGRRFLIFFSISLMGLERKALANINNNKKEGEETDGL